MSLDSTSGFLAIIFFPGSAETYFFVLTDPITRPHGIYDHKWTDISGCGPNDMYRGFYAYVQIWLVVLSIATIATLPWTIVLPSSGVADAAKTKKIANDTNGGPTLADSDLFGVATAPVGDLDGDGVIDLVVGAERDDTGGLDRGAVHILFMNDDGTVKSRQKIAGGLGGGPTL